MRPEEARVAGIELDVVVVAPDTAVDVRAYEPGGPAFGPPT